ncbi:DNA damage-binding protein 2-like isoform X1 [Ostrea edulis]|uniref:DNA damage-binding protein 2-like isoform X1 n=1 Tax=Ostrea edulis TaxID=37623 RepID=UPI0024AF7B7C|nr:DNA damage-binding protein 2-like isoform X1 [Ostrea edulis]
MPRKRRDDKTFESSQMGNGEDTKKVKLVDNGGVGTYAQKLKRKRDQVQKGKQVEEVLNHISNEVNEPDVALRLKSRTSPYTIRAETPSYLKSHNLAIQLHGYSMGVPRRNLYKCATHCVIEMLSDMQISTMTSPFNRRVTAMEWHPTNPDLVVVGSKGGDIIWWDTHNVKNQKFIQGMGAGGIINAIKFWPHDYSKILTAAVDGTVTLNDLEGKNTQILADTLNAHEFWYCSVDIHPVRKFIAAGDNVGKLQFLTYDGKKTFENRLHKNKITHCEFSPLEEWMMCTASTDQTVQIWDIRMIKDRKSSLYKLMHDKPVNSAHFSRTNGCRLLTTDQNNQVRVYLAPEWHLEKTILHPHRFFQHITPIKATWHPLLDLAVVGRYPDPNFTGYHENELRTIDIIDVDTEKIVTRLHDPSAPGLVCVNKFNVNGDTLLSGMGVNLLLWKRKEVAAKIQESLMSKISGKNLDQGSGGQTRSGRSNQSKRANEKLRKMNESKETKQKKAKLQLKVKEENRKGKK